MLPLSLACRIMVHGTQNFHESSLVLIQQSVLHMSFHGNLFYHYCQWCVWFCVFTEIGKKYQTENIQNHRHHWNNGKSEYHGRTYANNVVALEPVWICNNFEFREPELYKLVTTVTCDETKHKTYTVPVWQCALHTSVYVPNFMDMHHNELICLGESNKKEEPSNISDNKKTLTHCSWCTYLIIFTRQPELMYYIIIGISIVLYGWWTCVIIYHQA